MRSRIGLLVLLTAIVGSTGIALATPAVPCPGDCGNDGFVTVGKVVKGVNILLGTTSLSECQSFDSDGSGTVTVDELVLAVHALLSGCEPVASITPTNTPTEIPTQTPSVTKATDTPALLSPTPTLTPTQTLTVTPTLSPTSHLSPTRTPTVTPTGSVIPTTPGSCSNFDEQCMVPGTGVCQADGSCKGQAKADGTACDAHNPCMVSTTCQAGLCTGGTPLSGTECTIPLLGKCITGPTHCIAIPGFAAFCAPDDLQNGIVQCPENGDLCAPNVCDPADGTCKQQTTNYCALNPCSTGQCDPATGGCIPIGGIVTPTPTHGFTPPMTMTSTMLHPASPTPTPSRTATNGTPAATATTGTPLPDAPSVSKRAAGMTESISKVFLTIPNLLSGLLGSVGGAFQGGAGASLIDVNLPFTCPVSGNGSVGCTQDLVGFSLGPPHFAITLNACKVSNGSTASTFTGTINATGGDGDTCFSVPASLTPLNIPSLTATMDSGVGTTTATFTGINANVDLLLADSQNSACYYDTVTLHLTGTIAAVTKDTGGTTLSSTTATFHSGSDLTVTVSQFSTQQCVPLIYELDVDGTVDFVSDSNSLTATFTGYQLTADSTSGTTSVQVIGDVMSACFGPVSVHFDTLHALALSDGVPCPTDGEITVTVGAAAADRVIYTNTGGVQIDVGNNGNIDQTYTSCLNSGLFVCPAP